MCREVLKAVKAENQQVIEDVKRVAGEAEDSSWLPSSMKHRLCNVGRNYGWRILQHRKSFATESSTRVLWVSLSLPLNSF